MRRSHIDFILWDHDGVIVDTEPVFFEATRRTLHDVGLELTADAWRNGQAKGHRLETIFQHSTSATLDFRAIRRRRDDRYAELLETTDVVIPGAVEVVGHLATQCRMALVTTSMRRFVDQIHAQTDVLSWFEHIVTAEDCTKHKPDPEPYLRAMERLGALPGRCVAVEDSPRGLTAALSAGLRCYVVRSDFMAGAEFTGARPSHLC